MRINTNVSSLDTIKRSWMINSHMTSSMEKLSSGLKINKASDDASGLAIADKLRTQASSLKQSIYNANSAVTLLQIADKAMAEQSNILDIVKQKLIQGKTDTTSEEGLDSIAKDINKLLHQLDNIAEQTNYNGTTLLQESDSDMDSAIKLTFQIGENKNSQIETTNDIQSNTKGLGKITGVLNIEDLKSRTEGAAVLFSRSQIGEYMQSVDQALNDLNTFRANFGSTQNQLESSIRNMAVTETNIKAAESVIRDVDYAEESANFSKNNIIAQANTYALSQSNNVINSVTKLLQ